MSSLTAQLIMIFLGLITLMITPPLGLVILIIVFIFALGANADA